jgi:hypothetical protein
MPYPSSFGAHNINSAWYNQIHVVSAMTAFHFGSASRLCGHIGQSTLKERGWRFLQLRVFIL